MAPPIPRAMLRRADVFSISPKCRNIEWWGWGKQKALLVFQLSSILNILIHIKNTRLIWLEMLKSSKEFFEDCRSGKVIHSRDDAYSHTGGIFIPDTARDTAYSLWFNEAYGHTSLNHNEYAISHAVSRMKKPPVREYASSLVRYTLHTYNTLKWNRQL